MTHTPGPWHIEDLGQSRLIQILSDANGWVASTFDADARLIAAAPELLEALQAIVDDIGGNGAEQHNALVELVDAAIKKATGA